MQGEKREKYTSKYRGSHKEFYKWVIIFIVPKYFIIIANILKAEISWFVFKLKKLYLFQALLSHFKKNMH